MSHKKIFKIAVYGSAGGISPLISERSARVIGAETARTGNILCTGACEGIPHFAAVQAAEDGGLILGFSPAINIVDHVESFQFPAEPYILIFTGMEKKGRNLICTRTCDAGIFIAGRWGTMNEFTLMCDEGRGKVIGLLAGSGGFVDSKIIPGLQETDKPTEAVIVIEKDPHILMRRTFEELALLYP